MLKRLTLLVVALSVASAQSPCVLRVEHALGTACLKGRVERVAVLDWRPLEDLLLLGVKPVAGADLKDFPKWVPLDLPSGLPDLGSRTEPNLERLAALRPDLILGYSGFQGRLYPRLEALAPTVLLDYLPPKEQLSAMRAHFRLHARMVGKEGEADRILRNLDRKLAQARSLLAQKGLLQKPFLLLQPWTDGQVANVFTRDTLASELLEAMGLRNAWTGGAEAFGLSRVGLEGLAALFREHPSALVFYIAQPNFAPKVEALKPAGVRLLALPEDTWTYGGPASAEALVDRILGALGR
ncbi:ABC-type Fe3+-hydroxamate transport system, periplasmic component (plasmid) [Thermus oshimai JL-2]|uniref:ABC-type Fe3+-hydroxamate transport system, periplasmic component n=1 Tax=Thermus oshimai JL-2 TaxID=751945 RepID=K7R8G0_THEOS|nr:iron-siderophore ABC transporter substrate-binding protein [Thermus oshimai]AFV77344.1 ABC-type Fe3+-hydroxamate transport system, periplasmic component [Thermus oshimai JL-2]